MTEPTILTTADVARHLGVSARRVLALARHRGVGRKVGRDHLFQPADLERLKPRPPGRPKADQPRA